MDAVNRAAIFRVLLLPADDDELAGLLRAGYEFARLLRRAGPSAADAMH